MECSSGSELLAPLLSVPAPWKTLLGTGAADGLALNAGTESRGGDPGS